MAVGLETFAKVRALHDRTDSPGEKAAAMLKMQTLAWKAGMSVERASHVHFGHSCSEAVQLLREPVQHTGIS